jgi:hypothetical protein
MAIRIPFRHTQQIVINGEDDDTIVIGPPNLNGDDLDLTPQPSDRMDDADITVLPAAGERPS